MFGGCCVKNQFEYCHQVATRHWPTPVQLEQGLIVCTVLLFKKENLSKCTASDSHFHVKHISFLCADFIEYGNKHQCK